LPAGTTDDRICYLFGAIATAIGVFLVVKLFNDMIYHLSDSGMNRHLKYWYLYFYNFHLCSDDPNWVPRAADAWKIL